MKFYIKYLYQSQNSEYHTCAKWKDDGPLEHFLVHSVYLQVLCPVEKLRKGDVLEVEEISNGLSKTLNIKLTHVAL